MKKIATISIIVFLFSCKNEERKTSLDFINHVNKLELLSVDDKCGEWGGNKKIITIYRDNRKSPLLADFEESKMNCESGKSISTNNSRKRIKLNEKENQLILETIDQLVSIKINKQDKISHSGIINRVVMKDSSIYIDDFPSAQWSKFNELVETLKKE